VRTARKDIVKYDRHEVSVIGLPCSSVKY